MTLKEKFETRTSIDTTNEAKAFAKECEQIADKYAIEFAEWLIDTDNPPLGQAPIKQLLEIFKKEKGL